MSDHHYDIHMAQMAATIAAGLVQRTDILDSSGDHDGVIRIAVDLAQQIARRLTTGSPMLARVKCADAIVERLFINGASNPALRLVLADTDTTFARDLGGWSRWGARDEILRVLDAGASR